jgi:hypothetical protein
MIENPQSGLMKDQLEMWGIPFKHIDYCKHDVPYRKRTRIWNNVFTWQPKPLCNKDCNSMNNSMNDTLHCNSMNGKNHTLQPHKKHIATAQITA